MSQHSVIRSFTEYFYGVRCPVCGKGAKLVRWGSMAKGSMKSGKLTMVFWCTKEDCDTEFPIDLFTLSEDAGGDSTFEHRPEKVTRKHKSMHDMIAD